MNWFLMALTKYATFSGRAQRAEYWYFVLIYVFLYIGLSIIDAVAGTFSAQVDMGLFGAFLAIALFIPSIAVAVRRLHDTGRSGWWLLMGFLPLIGAIVLFVFMAQNSEAGANTYGPNPKDSGT